MFGCSDILIAIIDSLASPTAPHSKEVRRTQTSVSSSAGAIIPTKLTILHHAIAFAALHFVSTSSLS